MGSFHLSAFCRGKERNKQQQKGDLFVCFSVHVTLAVRLTTGTLCQHCLAFCGSSSSTLLNVHRDHKVY